MRQKLIKVDYKKKLLQVTLAATQCIDNSLKTSARRRARVEESNVIVVCVCLM